MLAHKKKKCTWEKKNGRVVDRFSVVLLCYCGLPCLAWSSTFVSFFHSIFLKEQDRPQATAPSTRHHRVDLKPRGRMVGV